MSHLRFKVVEEAFDRKAIPVEIPVERPEEYYGKYVFNRKKMLEYLPRETYDALVHAIDNKEHISREVADSVAAGMKHWAIDNGARHYSHWFHPLTDGTAEKHDAFIELQGEGIVENLPESCWCNKNLMLQVSQMVEFATLLRHEDILLGIYLPLHLS